MHANLIYFKACERFGDCDMTMLSFDVKDAWKRRRFAYAKELCRNSKCVENKCETDEDCQNLYLKDMKLPYHRRNNWSCQAEIDEETMIGSISRCSSYNLYPVSYTHLRAHETLR